VFSTMAQEVPLTSVNTGYEKLRLVRPREYSAMKESLAHYGQLSPVTVGRVAGDEKQFDLIDGFKRYRGLMELGKTSVRIRIMEGGRHALKAAIVGLNRSQGTLHAFEEALVAHSLHRDDCLSQPQIAALLGRHKSWACRRIALCERLCEEAIENIRLGLLGFSVARELWRLPRGNQPDALQCILKHGLDSRETVLLIKQLLQSPAYSHANILWLPLDILEQRQSPRPAGMSKALHAWRKFYAILKTAHTRVEPLLALAGALGEGQRVEAVTEVVRAADMLSGLKTALQGSGDVG
jgi:ParB-like chromosome segregation protein Spo0J